MQVPLQISKGFFWRNFLPEPQTERMLAVAIALNERGGEKKAHICLMQHHAGMKREGFTNVKIVFGAVFLYLCYGTFLGSIAICFSMAQCPLIFEQILFSGGTLGLRRPSPPLIPPLKHVTLAANTSQEKKERRKEQQRKHLSTQTAAE